MTVVVKLFSVEAQAAGTREATVELPRDATCAALRNALTAAYPALASRMEKCRVAVNHEFAADAMVVRQGDEVALIGPVSGG